MEAGTDRKTKTELYVKYPLSSGLIYTVLTVMHFLLGAVGIWAGFGAASVFLIFGTSYLIVVVTEMYALRPGTWESVSSNRCESDTRGRVGWPKDGCEIKFRILRGDIS